MMDKQGVGFSCIAILALAGTVGGCGADAAGASDGAGVERAAFTSIKGDVGFVLSTLVTTGTVTADPNYSFNSAGGTNSITHLAGTGQYRVDMPNLGSTIGGHIEVTPFGNGAKYCKVVNWLSSGSTLQAFVNCFNSFSSATESSFFLTYNRRSDTPGAEGAYVWAFDASSASYDASSSWSWNSTGGALTITHTPGTNTYSVALAGQDLSKGTVQVTAYGSGNAFCKVVGWGGSAVTVACFSNGSPAESRFDLLFSTRSPNGTPSSSYLWANQPSTPSYNPSSTYALGLLSVDCCSDPIVVSTPPTITRTASGQYTVRLPAMASISAFPLNVKVTGYGSGTGSCQVSSVSQSGADAIVKVNCFTPFGGPFNDQFFTLTYSSFAYTIG